MTDTWRPAADAVTADLQTIFGSRLQSVVAYGPHIEGHDAPLTCLALVATLTIADLEACAQHSPRWTRARIATPLILPTDEFRRSLDAFPLEYGEIIRSHQRVYGDDPLAGISIARDDLRRACETQIKGHLVHLREAFIETGGRPTGIAEVVADSAAAFGALLRNVARLTGVHSSNRMDATLAGALAADLPQGVVTDVLSLEQPATVPHTDAARLFPQYLAVVEQLARAVDTWR